MAKERKSSRGQKAARGLGEPRRDRTLDAARDAGSATHRPATGPVDLRDDPRASLRNQVEEGVLRIAGPRVDHRDGGLRRLRQRRLLGRRGPGPAAAARHHRPVPLRQGEDPRGGRGTGDAHVDRASRARAGVGVRIGERWCRALASWQSDGRRGRGGGLGVECHNASARHRLAAARPFVSSGALYRSPGRPTFCRSDPGEGAPAASGQVVRERLTLAVSAGRAQLARRMTFNAFSSAALPKASYAFMMSPSAYS